MNILNLGRYIGIGGTLLDQNMYICHLFEARKICLADLTLSWKCFKRTFWQKTESFHKKPIFVCISKKPS